MSHLNNLSFKKNPNQTKPKHKHKTKLRVKKKSKRTDWRADEEDVIVQGGDARLRLGLHDKRDWS
jgi:hypothetical protein